jgi:hypothetical protein
MIDHIEQRLNYLCAIGRRCRLCRSGVGVAVIIIIIIRVGGSGARVARLLRLFKIITRVCQISYSPYRTSVVNKQWASIR